MSENDAVSENGDQHSVIVADCNGCTEVDVVTLLEHGRRSPQHHAVLSANETLIDEHHEETGHNVEYKHFGGSPGEMLDVARTWARKVEGVPNDAFSEELIA